LLWSLACTLVATFVFEPALLYMVRASTSAAPARTAKEAGEDGRSAGN